jgi:hypothetical protein
VDFASENLAEGGGGGARQEVLERFSGVAILVEMLEETSDGVGDLGGNAAITDGARDGSDLANAAANAEVVSVNHLAIELDFFAFDADVGDPMLSAGIGAAGDVKAKIFLIVRETIFELLGEPARKGLGFGKSEFAELRAGAGDGAAGEGRGGIDRKPGGVEFADNVVNVGLGNVDEKEILHGGVADTAVAVAVGEIGGEAELRRGDASSDDRSADGEEAGLLLRDDTEMVSMNARGELFRRGGGKRIAETGFDGGEEGVSGPVVFEEEELEAGFVAGLAEDFGFTEDFSDSPDDGDDLVRKDEGVEAESEVRLRGEAAADAEGEAEFGKRCGERRVGG